jgi:hypothetical protein
LQPFANALAKLPPEDLREDVDPSRLDAALRNRIRGLDEKTASEALIKDGELLERWLKDKGDHPAHWIRGYLYSPELATYLMQPPEPQPRGPEIHFEAPPGWKGETLPFALELIAGEVLAGISVIDESTFNLLQLQFKQAVKNLPADAQASTEVSDVSFGPCRGKKYLYRTTAPAAWKQGNYVLSVPGGYVTIIVGTITGADFDETPLESKLHTLRLSE